ncbi:hypothetical protein ACN4EG_06100 [Alkalinema pantanalense CENA528]|uniref:hypothetical protein n=1 Tax=Alkalinema pantanalense TaxID=1620705 RepID=UPI003D701FB8
MTQGNYLPKLPEDDNWKDWLASSIKYICHRQLKDRTRYINQLITGLYKSKVCFAFRTKFSTLSQHDYTDALHAALLDLRNNLCESISKDEGRQRKSYLDCGVGALPYFLTVLRSRLIDITRAEQAIARKEAAGRDPSDLSSGAEETPATKSLLETYRELLHKDTDGELAKTSSRKYPQMTAQAVLLLRAEGMSFKKISKQLQVPYDRLVNKRDGFFPTKCHPLQEKYAELAMKMIDNDE